MIQIQRILCPIDFSDFSRRALDHAMAIASWYESTVTLVHVAAIAPPEVFAPGAGAFTSAALTIEDREALQASMKRFAESEGASSVPLVFEVAEGYPSTEILGRADEMPADLLVLGTHGRSGFERLVLGSVTERVLRKAACPVLSVPRGVPDVVPAPPVLFKHIVCAIDFSTCSMRALNFARSMAQEADAHLTVVHVVEFTPDLAPDLPEKHETGLGGPRILLDYIAQAEEDRRARLKEAIPDAVRAYCTVDTVLAAGKPYREILRIAAERQSDVIVIGIHGRGAIDRMLFGSTAQHLVRQASCPVLTLRTH
jgi:nucleotide-binding universal stress UspA family protein